MKILGVAPKGTFSGFENTFFNAIRQREIDIDTLHVELKLFKLLCTLFTIRLDKSTWGLKRDLAYNTSIKAFEFKSNYVQNYLLKSKNKYDAIYQIGGLWNPLPNESDIPLILSIDYTSLLSEIRGSEWKRSQGAERDFWIKSEKALFDRANMICATTHNAKNSLVRDYNVSSDKICVVGPGVSHPYDIFEPTRLPDYCSKRILFVGKGFLGKGLDTLLKAFEIVKNRVPQAILTIIGPSVEINGNGIEYIGRVSDKEIVKEWYYKSALFAMPSIFEPVGQVFLEAMSCKLPCIGTTLDAMPELIEDSVTGYTVSPGNHLELADRILSIISSPDNAATMGRAGFDKLMNEFTWDVVGGKIQKCIFKAMNK